MLQSLAAHVFAILLLTPLTAAAQDLMEPDLKAEFTYNFAEFTEWPANAVATGGPLVFCVLGEAAISEALEQLVEGRALASHRSSPGTMRNTFDAQYSDPVSSQHRQDAIAQNGRTVRVELRWNLWES